MQVTGKSNGSNSLMYLRAFTIVDSEEISVRQVPQIVPDLLRTNGVMCRKPHRQGIPIDEDGKVEVLYLVDGMRP